MQQPPNILVVLFAFMGVMTLVVAPFSVRVIDSLILSGLCFLISAGVYWCTRLKTHSDTSILDDLDRVEVRGDQWNTVLVTQVICIILLISIFVIATIAQ